MRLTELEPSIYEYKTLKYQGPPTYCEYGWLFQLKWATIVLAPNNSAGPWTDTIYDRSLPQIQF